LLVDDTLFYCTSYNRVFALDPETGKEKWVFDPKLKKDGRAILACRGLSSWKDETKSSSEKCHHRIMGVTIDAELFSIDGKKRYYKKIKDKTSNYLNASTELGNYLKLEAKDTYKT